MLKHESCDGNKLSDYRPSEKVRVAEMAQVEAKEIQRRRIWPRLNRQGRQRLIGPVFPEADRETFQAIAK